MSETANVTFGGPVTVKMPISLSPIGEAAILIMEAAILDEGTRNEPITVAPIARIERGSYAMPAAVYLQCVTVHAHTYKLYSLYTVHCDAKEKLLGDALQIDRSRRSVSTLNSRYRGCSYWLITSTPIQDGGLHDQNGGFPDRR